MGGRAVGGGRWGGTMRGARWGDRGDRERYARVRGVRRCGDMGGGGCRSEGAWARVRGAWRRAEAWCVRMWGARRVRAGGVRRARAGARHVGLRGDVMRGAAGRARERGRGLAACAAAASRGAARGAARRRGTCRRGAREGTRGTGESRRLGAPAVARGGGRETGFGPGRPALRGLRRSGRARVRAGAGWRRAPSGFAMRTNVSRETSLRRFSAFLTIPPRGIKWSENTLRGYIPRSEREVPWKSRRTRHQPP